MKRELEEPEIGKLTSDMLDSYCAQLAEEEKSELTLEKYRRDLRKFQEYLGGRNVSKELVIRFKEQLIETYAVSSVNSMLAAVNGFLGYAGWHRCKVKQIRQQRQVYCPEEKELTKEEYFRLIRAAKEMQNERLSLIMQTICSTGIRISELSFITVNAIQHGMAQVDCKGKYRQILIPQKLRLLLMQYIKSCHLKEGPVFITKKGKPIDRSNLWKEMKKLCIYADVAELKVFPHNLRHLFARTYYQMEKDIAKLADLLGHSSVNTTRIYIVSSGGEHKRQIERMKLIL